MGSLGCLPSLLFFLWVQCSVGQCLSFLFLFLLFRLFWLDSLGVSLLWSSYHRLQVQGVETWCLAAARRVVHVGRDAGVSGLDPVPVVPQCLVVALGLGQESEPGGAGRHVG